MNLATATRAQTAAVANHLNVQPVFDIYAACQGRDLGGVAKDIKVIVDRAKAKLPNHSGTFIFIGGQVMSMQLAFIALIAFSQAAMQSLPALVQVAFESLEQDFSHSLQEAMHASHNAIVLAP